ncbi:apolipoprotein N-acyltransferase [Deferribacter autotrophicus]|uniref:Apolipoprotein N-acyltransferase n=1 Tax=Deferribacter autotrophicus TaxID=500465 RepID=A0A5A8F753_9BACT|nr:apolipoprotein N-acyltransferase [Deferribacter autotrophicus]KAA0259545.1 apolipoprotein N-acyltransferase [Deferribacter autotrophicus]
MQSIGKIVFPILSAILLIFSTPGYDFYPFAFIAFVPVLFTISKSNKIFLPSILFGTLFYVFTLKWIIITISDFGNAPKIVGLLILVAFSIYLSLYYYLFFLCFKKKFNIILLASIFVILEIVKGYLFTGFPWLNLGLTQYNNHLFKNIYSVIGENGVSFLIILFNLALFNLFFKKKYLPVIFTILFLVCLIFVGNFGVKDFKKSSEINVAVIQPAYDQKEKWNPFKKDDLINDVLDLLNQIKIEDVEIVVMPESVFPTFCNNEKELIDYLANSLHDKSLIFGCLRYEGEVKKKYYNSVFFINRNELFIYDKIHLVPFGEYFPLKSLLKPIEYYFFQGAEDFSHGNEFVVFNDGNIKYATPLCYESAYTFLIRKFLKRGANVLVFLTNDSWFGYSNGRKQHLAIDIVRSYEFYKPVIRGTQSGISACINPINNDIKLLPVGEKGILECKISLISGSTIFNKITYWWLLIFIVLGIIIEIKWKKSKKTY